MYAVLAILGAGWLSLGNRHSHVARHVAHDGKHVYEDQELS